MKIQLPKIIFGNLTIIRISENCLGYLDFTNNELLFDRRVFALNYSF
jgi:hypothetical protein